MTTADKLSVTANDVARTIDSYAVNDKTVTLTLASPIMRGQAVNVTYDSTGNTIAFVEGGTVPVTNGVQHKNFNFALTYDSSMASEPQLAVEQEIEKWRRLWDATVVNDYYERNPTLGTYVCTLTVRKEAMVGNTLGYATNDGFVLVPYNAKYHRNDATMGTPSLFIRPYPGYYNDNNLLYAGTEGTDRPYGSAPRNLKLDSGEVLENEWLMGVGHHRFTEAAGTTYYGGSRASNDNGKDSGVTMVLKSQLAGQSSYADQADCGGVVVFKFEKGQDASSYTDPETIGWEYRNDWVPGADTRPEYDST